MDLVFLGIQGSGKGTQASRLTLEHNYHIFEAGLELRNLAKEQTELGKQMATLINNGQLVPAKAILAITEAALVQKDPSQTILFDGVPRDLDQMKLFDELMEKLGREFIVVNFQLSKEKALERIASRAKLEGRIDDEDLEKVERRLGWFVDKNMPVIDVYRTQDKVIDIDASQDRDAIYADLLAALSL